MSTTIERYEALCQKHGLDPNALPDVSNVPKERKKYNLASERLAVITKCYNAEDENGNLLEVGWTPDYSIGSRQPKYEIWFEVVENKSSVSGFGLAYLYYDFWITSTDCGGRLCFKDMKTARRAFDDFKEYYEDFYLPA